MATQVYLIKESFFVTPRVLFSKYHKNNKNKFDYYWSVSNNLSDEKWLILLARKV